MATSLLHADDIPDTVLMFSYFRGNGESGLHLAWSRDGLTWEAFNEGRPVLIPEIGGRLMRDPCIIQGPDGTFHMVWTTGWWERSIGVAHSKDLINWSEQKLIPVMEHQPTARNSWAPEIIYDPEREHFMIFWATTIPGKFPETEFDGRNHNNHRIYKTTTRDFVTFTPAELFFQPGFNVIDSTLLPIDGRVYMFFKDESAYPRLMKNTRLAVADTIAGPFTVDPNPVTPLGRSVEGPTAIKIGDYVHVYMDAYGEGQFRLFRSRDMRNWEEITTRLSMPRGIRHGTVFQVSGDVVRRLLENDRQARAPGAIINPIIPQRADPHVWLHTDGYYYLTATVPAFDRIELRRARTIAGLATAEVKTVWHRHERGPMSHHIWAPEIHFIDGKWHIYFAAGRAEAIWDIRMYALSNASPNPMEGTWTEEGRIYTDWDSFSLDATTFEHRGNRYYVWAQSRPNIRGTSLFIARMDTPTSIISPQVMISEPEFDWERRGHYVNEAPSVIIRNGRVFMTYSASATDHNYCLGLLTADEDANLLDPASWAKSPTPVFHSNVATSQYGPGHNSFTTSPDGKVDFLVYHARNFREIRGEPLHNPYRATRVQVLHWNEDGTPNFGIPVADGPLQK